MDTTPLPLKLFFLSLLITALIYLPGLGGPFLFDDNPNIVTNSRVHINDLSWDSLSQAAHSSPASAFGRPLSALSFGINHYFTELDPYGFKVVNLMIHLINGCLVFWVSLLLLKTAFQTKTFPSPVPPIQTAYWVALATASLWLLNPINLSPTLYVVQRMASLSTLFILIGLLIYLMGRQRMLRGDKGRVLILSSLFLLTPLAFLSKENGIILPGLLWVIEYTLLRFNTFSPKNRLFLIWLFNLTVALPIILVCAYILINPGWLLAGYDIKPFTLGERLFTESRVIWFYLGLILLPRLNEFSLFHDDFILSTGLLSPWQTLPAIIGILLLILSVFALRKRFPVLAFGIGFFLIGHSLESTIFPLELAQEHRNYLSSIGILFSVAFGLLTWKAGTSNIAIGKITLTALLVLMMFITGLRAFSWASPISQAIEEAENHPLSTRAQFSAGRTYAIALLIAQKQQAENDAMTSEKEDFFYQKARKHFLKSAELSQASTLGLASLVLLNTRTGLPVLTSTLDEIERRLANPQQTHIDHVISLLTLINAHIKQPDQIPAKRIKSMFAAAITNPHHNDSNQANLLARYASFKMKQEHNSTIAIAAMLKAIELAPKALQHQMSLINILASDQQWQAALANIKKLQEKDTYGKMNVQIARILATIRNEQAAEKANNKP